MDARFDAIVAPLLLALTVPVSAYLMVEVLRALELAGAKATFRHALVVVLCTLPLGTIVGALPDSVTEKRVFELLGWLGLYLSLSSLLHFVAFVKGFGVSPADALVAVLAVETATMLMALLITDIVFLFIAFPLAVVAAACLLALGLWVEQAHRIELEERLNSVLLER